VLKQALQAGSAVSTLVASAKAQGVDRPAPTASSHQKRRAAARQIEQRHFAEVITRQY